MTKQVSGKLEFHDLHVLGHQHDFNHITAEVAYFPCFGLFFKSLWSHLALFIAFIHPLFSSLNHVDQFLHNVTSIVRQ